MTERIDQRFQMYFPILDVLDFVEEHPQLPIRGVPVLLDEQAHQTFQRATRIQRRIQGKLQDMRPRNALIEQRLNGLRQHDRLADASRSDQNDRPVHAQFTYQFCKWLKVRASRPATAFRLDAVACDPPWILKSESLLNLRKGDFEYFHKNHYAQNVKLSA